MRFTGWDHCILARSFCTAQQQRRQIVFSVVCRPTPANISKPSKNSRHVSHCHKQSLGNATRVGSNAGSYRLRNCIPHAPATTTPFRHHRVDDFTRFIALPGTPALSFDRHAEKFDSSALPNDEIAACKAAPQQRSRRDISRFGIRNGSATGHAP